MKNQIDWHKQWELHGHNFKDGLVHIEYANKPFTLTPGPGFGDFSHPTTRLVLQMMQPYVAGKRVLDVGCGSGVLSIGACAFGAKTVHGIDIDPDAIEHAKQNAHINGFEKISSFSFDAKPAEILLMNMIRSEQQIAYKSFEIDQAFTSGILAEGLEEYITLTKTWGWQLIDMQNESGWLGFHFMCKRPLA